MSLYTVFRATELQVPLEVILKFWKPIDFKNSSRVLVVFGYLPKNQEPRTTRQGKNTVLETET